MPHKIIFSLLLAVTVAETVAGQTSSKPSTAEVAHYPQVTHADVPLYPPIARAAHITGTVEIQIVVEKGTVIDAKVKSVAIDASTNGAVLNGEGEKKVGPYLSNSALANVKTWQFDSGDRISFAVKYVYRIAGEATSLPESPMVELNLPVLVKVTSPPLKPTCMDCGADIGGSPVR
jgi:hypothetical protein